jgi:PAS domain S-box-containing protein
MDRHDRTVTADGDEPSSYAVDGSTDQIVCDPSELALLQELACARIDRGDGSLYQRIADTAAKLLHSDMASVQALVPRNDGGSELLLLAAHGFCKRAHDVWSVVHPDPKTVCGAALERGGRVICPDIEAATPTAMALDTEEFRACGIRAVQSTPLVTRGGETLGMLSTHWCGVHEPTAHELGLVDLLARQTADLLESHRVHDGLRRRASEFEALLHNAPLGIYVVDADFRIRDVNPTAREVFNFVPDLVGSDFEAMIHRLWPKHYADEVARCFRHTLVTGEPYSAPERIERRLDTGIVESYAWEIHRIPLEGGRPGVVCYFRDISKEVVARVDLADSAERYRTLVSILTDVALTMEPTGLMVPPQPAWSAFTGQSDEELRGAGWANAVHPDDRPRIVAMWTDCAATGRRFETTGRLWNQRLREYRYVASRATPIRRADGTIAEWVGTCTDVHESRVKEEALIALNDDRETLLAQAEHARREAEKANSAKDEFLAVLSHELRSPLNAMLGWVSILKRAGSKDELVARAVETLERNIWTQSQVINDLLDVSRITSGKLQLDRARVDLSAAVHGTVESMQPMADGKQIGIEVRHTARRCEVEGDAARLQQIIGNLLHNAIKFTPEKGRIAVRMREDGDDIVVEVEDNGPGIDDGMLPHIFDRFVQSGSSTTRKHGGLGLGLAIVSQLTALHGGSVSVRNVGGRAGCLFTIRLPLAPAAEADVALDYDDEIEQVPAADGLQVLLVEDDPDSREALGIALEQAGIVVRLAASVPEALTLYDRRIPDVVVSDIGMPGEDGYTLIRRIREREDGSNRHTLAIAMTGFATRQDHESALRAGFDEHVGKPVEPEALLERIRVLAESKKGGEKVMRTLAGSGRLFRARRVARRAATEPRH